ncbi:alpha/beta hydrolase family protein [Laceyella putida]|uniref:Alpha/beta hydrolase n=1 Tax=Laceyella putida TaxID=110101 RepID=A0ABW2RKF1_9BACL
MDDNFHRQMLEFQQTGLVSGHSSGGLITTWIASNRPELVNGVVLEDPPYFSSIMPRAKKTAGGDLARVTHDFVSQKQETDFQKYYVQNREWRSDGGNG